MQKKHTCSQNYAKGCKGEANTDQTRCNFTLEVFPNDKMWAKILGFVAHAMLIYTQSTKCSFACDAHVK